MKTSTPVNFRLGTSSNLGGPMFYKGKSSNFKRLQKKEGPHRLKNMREYFQSQQLSILPSIPPPL